MITTANATFCVHVVGRPAKTLDRQPRNGQLSSARKGMAAAIVLLALAPAHSLAQQWESATDLTGSVLVQCIFLDTPDEVWSPAEKRYYLALTYKNMCWLRGQAKRYQKDLTFRIDTSCSGKLHRTFDTAMKNRKAFVPVLEQLTNNDPLTHKRSKGADNHIVVFYLAAQGRAYANPTNQTRYPLEHCVIHKHEPQNIAEIESVIAHEILHLFGASDLYRDEPARQEKLHALYPQEVMHTVGPLELLNLSDFTAYLVGWHPEWQDAFGETNRVLWGE